MRLRIKFYIINHLIKLFISIIVVFAVTVLLLVSYFSIDVTAKGKGTVKSLSWVGIKSEISGIIAETHVVEGEEVKMGQLLFTLEDRERKIEFENTLLRIEKIQLAIDTLRNKKVLFEVEINTSIRQAKAALIAEKTKLDMAIQGPKKAALAIAADRIRRAREKSAKLKADFRRIKKAFELKVVSELDFYNALYEMQTSDVELSIVVHELELLKNKYDDAQIIGLKANVEQRKAALDNTLARRDEIDILMRESAALQKEYEYEKRQLAVSKKYLDLTRVKTPIGGYVLTREIEHLIGKAVSAGSVVLKIADRNEYIVDCSVSEMDFPLIETGQKANVTIRPFPKGEYKLFNAVVMRVGAESINGFSNAGVGMINDAANSLKGQFNRFPAGIFPVVLRLEKPYSMEVFGQIYMVKPGFTADVEIVLNKENIATLILRRVLRIKGKVATDKIHLS